MQSVHVQPEIHTKILSLMKKSVKETKDRKKNSDVFIDVSTKSSVFIFQKPKCPNLKCNINKNLLNGTVSLNSYEGTGET